MSLIHTFRPPVRGPFPWLAGLCLLALPAVVRAGGPIAGTTTGLPVRWDTSQSVTYVVDKGPLGSRNHATAVRLIERGFQPWMDAPLANAAIEPAGELSQDITGRNVLSFL